MTKPTVRRSFEVDAPLEEAWQRLAEVERWPEWAPHIVSVSVSPPGALGPTSVGAFKIRRLGRNTFRMSAWEPPVRWEWVGGLPGVRISYDHRFETAGPAATRLEWAVEVRGPLAPIIRPIFARVYGRNVDRAIPRLQEWFRNHAEGTRRSISRAIAPPKQVVRRDDVIPGGIGSHPSKESSSEPDRGGRTG